MAQELDFSRSLKTKGGKKKSNYKCSARLFRAGFLHIYFVASSLLALTYLSLFFPIRQFHLFLPLQGVFPTPETATVGFSYSFASSFMATPLLTPGLAVLSGRMPGRHGPDLCLGWHSVSATWGPWPDPTFSGSALLGRGTDSRRDHRVGQ